MTAALKSIHVLDGGWEKYAGSFKFREMTAARLSGGAGSEAASRGTPRRAIRLLHGRHIPEPWCNDGL